MARCVEFNEVEKIEKAMNVFWEKGYAGTSMQDLVDAMQINRSSLYNTIGDKHQLFMKCISTYFLHAMEDLKSKVAKETSAKQALVNLITDKAIGIVSCDKVCLGMKTIFEVATENQEVRTILKVNNEIFLAFLTEMVQKAMDAKEIKNTEEATLIAEYIAASFTGWKQSYILDRNPVRIKNMSAFLIKTILN